MRVDPNSAPQEISGSGLLTNSGPGGIVWADEQTLTTTVNNGTVASGATLPVDGTIWVLAAGNQAAEINLVAAASAKPVRCILNNANGAQSVTSAAPAVKAQWDTAREDPLGMWAGGTSGDITIKQSGFYIITCCPSWLEQSSTGVRAYHLQVSPLGVAGNAVMLCAHHIQPTVYNGCFPFTWAGPLNATDVIAVYVYHENGSTIHWGGSNRPLVSLNQSRNCEICVAKID